VAAVRPRHRPDARLRPGRAPSGLEAVWSSREAKAIEAAGLLAAGFRLPIRLDEGLGENGRPATGFLPPAEFARVADAFFADPHRSVRGWERAIDAQERVARTVARILDAHGDGAGGDIAFVAHGRVGALLLCRLLGAPISRGRDQPFQGHFFAFGPPGRKIIQEWRPIAER
jgi:broad specificity phosphatase PhoE